VNDPTVGVCDFVAAGNDEDAPAATIVSVRDRYLPVIPGLDPGRFGLEIVSRPQSSLPDPWAASAFSKVAVPSGKFAQFVRI
jgi:hypothetical protein